MLPPSLRPQRSSLSKAKIAYDVFVEVVDQTKDQNSYKQTKRTLS